MRFKFLFGLIVSLTFIMGIPLFLNILIAPSGEYREPTSEEQNLITQAGVDNNVVIVENLHFWGTPIAGYVNMFEFNDTVYMRPFGDKIKDETVWMSKLIHETAHVYQKDTVSSENGFGWGYIFGLMNLNSISEDIYVGEDYNFGLVSFAGLERNADCMSVILGSDKIKGINLTYTGEYEDCDSKNVVLAENIIQGNSLTSAEINESASNVEGFSNANRTARSFEK